MAEGKAPRRSGWVIILCVFAALVVVASVVGLIWAKNTGTPITADEPYRWDGQSNIMIAYHADYQPGEETCTVTSVDEDWKASPFHMGKYHRDLGGVMGVRGESLLRQNYGSEAIITCAKDGDRVLTGGAAIAAKYWLYGQFMAVWALVAAFIVHVRRLRKR